VRRVKSDNVEWLRRRREEIAMRVIEKFEAHREELLDSWVKTASDSENRQQPQMARVMGEFMGAIGKNRIHIGDVHHNTANVQVLAEYAADYDPSLEAALRAELGLDPV
jgi:hypothetical protein